MNLIDRVSIDVPEGGKSFERMQDGGIGGLRNRFRRMGDAGWVGCSAWVWVVGFFGRCGDGLRDVLVITRDCVNLGRCTSHTYI